MQELENLLTSLVQRGRKPWGIEWVDRIFCAYSKPMLVGYDNTGKPIWPLNPRSLRELVSLESGLWQFVCDNKLYKETNKSWQSWGVYVNSVNVVEFCSCSLPQFRLLESALIPEEELGKFLVDNIKVEWKN